MENIKVLVVDDESRMRKLVKDFLTREGYAVLEAGDGMEAMDIFYEDKEIALVILDVMMPKMVTNFKGLNLEWTSIYQSRSARRFLWRG